jgi:hypothetical protein
MEAQVKSRIIKIGGLYLVYEALSTTAVLAYVALGGTLPGL